MADETSDAWGQVGSTDPAEPHADGGDEYDDSDDGGEDDAQLRSAFQALSAEASPQQALCCVTLQVYDHQFRG